MAAGLYKTIIVDPLPDKCVAYLEQNGIKTEYSPTTTYDELAAKIEQFDCLVIRSRLKIDRDIIGKGKNLKVIARAGIGVDNVDVEAATRKGILILNTPKANVIAAAEHTFALLLTLARKIYDAYNAIKNREWNRSKFIGTELDGKTLGIVGFGKVGSIVNKYARSFGMKVIAYDPYITTETAEKFNIALMDLKTLLQSADFITLHLPLNEQTRHMIGKEQLALMKKTAYVVNTSRGGVIDEPALAAALREGIIAGCALDVFEQEPLPKGSKLPGLPNLILTPHLGASTQEAQQKVATEISEQIVQFFKYKTISTAVNVAQIDDPNFIKYLELGYVTGSIISKLADSPIHNTEISYRGSFADQKNSAITNSIICGILKETLDDSANLINAHIIAQERDLKISEKFLKHEKSKPIIEVSIGTENGPHTIISRLAEGKDIRIIKVDSFTIDLTPSTHMLAMRYPDIPGVVGKFGTVLGNNDINIASMTVGRLERGKKAMIFVTIDDPVTDKVIAELKQKIGDVDFVKYIRVGATPI